MYAKEDKPEKLSCAPLLNSPSTYHLQAISEEPLFPLKPSEIKEVIRMVFKSSLPTSFSFLAGLISGMTCMGFIGNYGTPTELAGASIATTWIHLFCLGIMTSINVGFQVMASQLFGASKRKELDLLYRKTICLLLIVLGPLMLFLSFADTILITFGLNEDVAIVTGVFLRCSFPSLVGIGIFECTRAYLMAQNHFLVQSFIQVIAASLNFFWCYLFVDLLEMPLAGAAISRSITDITAVTMLVLYIKYKHISEFNYPLWSWEYVEGCLSHLRKTLSIGGNVYIFICSYGISGFIVSLFNDEYVTGAHGIGLLLSSLLSTLPLGNAVAMQTYIGNAFGEGSKTKAQKVIFAGYSINLCYVFINITFLIAGKEAIASFFTNDATTRAIFMDIILLIALVHCPDTLIEHLSCTMRPIGNEKELLIACVICFWLIGLVFQWFFGVMMGYGYMGIWLSIGFAALILCVFLFFKLATLNWEDKIKTLKQQIQKKTEIYIELVQ